MSATAPTRPMIPRMSPAIAMPEALRPSRLACPMCTAPKMIASSEPSPDIHTMPRTSDAIAKPSCCDGFFGSRGSSGSDGDGGEGGTFIVGCAPSPLSRSGCVIVPFTPVGHAAHSFSTASHAMKPITPRATMPGQKRGSWCQLPTRSARPVWQHEAQPSNETDPAVQATRVSLCWSNGPGTRRLSWVAGLDFTLFFTYTTRPRGACAA